MPHHGLDLVEPGTRYSAGHFARDAEGWLADVRGRGRMPVVVGGTGLYVRALAEGLFREPPLDPARRRSLDAFTARLEPLELLRWAGRLDPGFRGGGRQRAARAIEVALLTGHPLSHWQAGGARAGRPRSVVHCAHGAPARAAPADRAAGGGDGAARADRGSRLGAGRRTRRRGRRGSTGSAFARRSITCTGGGRAASVADAIAVSTRQYAKRQQTWFRHQLGGVVLTLDATRPPERLAAEIAEAWEKDADMKIGISCGLPGQSR